MLTELAIHLTQVAISHAIHNDVNLKKRAQVIEQSAYPAKVLPSNFRSCRWQ
jgi:hypothetical protein